MLGKKRKYVLGGSTRKTKKVRPNLSGLTRLPRLGNQRMLSRGQYIKVNLSYCDTISINSAGPISTYLFSANGVYDPDITGTGHQPAGFDSYMQLYELYMVTKSTIRVTFVNADTANQQLVGVYSRDLTSTSSDYREYLENGGGVWRILGTKGSGNDICDLYQQMDIAQFSNNHDIMNEDNYAGNSASQPQEQQYYHIIVGPPDPAVNPSEIRIVVRIDYEVYFRQPVMLPIS